jgi:hypothetical protein
MKKGGAAPLSAGNKRPPTRETEQINVLTVDREDGEDMVGSARALIYVNCQL